jgi:nitrite reductase (NADH) small subunit
MSDWIPICHLQDIAPLGSRRVARPQGAEIALFRNSRDQVFALLDRCPHKGGPLSQGLVFEQTVSCPLHNWSIQLDTGCAMAPDEGCTVRFSVKIDGGMVHLEADELMHQGLDDNKNSPCSP